MAIRQNDEDADDQEFLLGLSALSWTLEDGNRSERLLALTGLSVGDLRASAGEPAMLAEILRFLENHEPDLIACAAKLDVKPADLVQARTKLENYQP